MCVGETDKNSPNLMQMLVAMFAFYDRAEINYIWLTQFGVDDPAGPGCATTCKYSLLNHFNPLPTKLSKISTKKTTQATKRNTNGTPPSSNAQPVSLTLKINPGSVPISYLAKLQRTQAQSPTSSFTSAPTSGYMPTTHIQGAAHSLPVYTPARI